MAAAAPGSYFAGWSISASDCGGSRGPCTFEMTAPDLEVGIFRLDHCLVPNVKGLPLANARRQLAAYSCRLGRKTYAYSSRVAKGAVISEKPEVGSRRERGARVNLVISRGKRH